MRSLLFKTRFVVLFIFILSISGCEKECPPIEPMDKDKLKIKLTVNNQYRADAGGGGLVNGEYKEFDYAEITVQNNGMYGIQIIEFEWYQNSVWAARQALSIRNIHLAYNHMNGDTIWINKHPFANLIDPFAFISHLYFDGDAAAECYEIDDEAETKSWLRIIQYDVENEILTGELNLSLELSDECPPKYDETQPDYIKLEDFFFRAKLRE